MEAHQKELAWALAKLESQKEILEVQTRVIEAEMKLKLYAEIYSSIDAHTKLASLRGLINSRGMIKLAEERFEKSNPELRRKPRALKWKEGLEMREYSDLKRSILDIDSLQLNSSEQVGNCISVLYQELSLRAGKSTLEELLSWSGKLDINVAGLSPERGRLVACLAKYLRIHYVFTDNESEETLD